MGLNLEFEMSVLRIVKFVMVKIYYLCMIVFQRFINSLSIKGQTLCECAAVTVSLCAIMQPLDGYSDLGGRCIFLT